MARGDMKPSRSTGGRSYRGSGRTYSHNDQGRGNSKNLFGEFEAFFIMAEDKEAWLLQDNTDRSLAISLHDERLYFYIHNFVMRHNIHDWAWSKFEDSAANDGRVRRLVVAHCGVEIWNKLQIRAKSVWERKQREDEELAAERAAQDAVERAAFDAERVKRMNELRDGMRNEIQLITGAIDAEFNASFSEAYAHDADEGDLDNVVDAYSAGSGFELQTQQAHGIKLQITLSLDCSNSMYYNKLSDIARNAFTYTWMSLEAIKAQHPDDLFIGAFTFSQDWYSSSSAGKYARCINHYTGYGKHDKSEITDVIVPDKEKYPLGIMDPGYNRMFNFDGTDTWFYTLFEKVAEWESKHSDPGAYRLDLIITDAVIEHKVDIARSDAIQERRNGSLQTVLLNFMPERDWVNSDLPMRCVQYAVNAENIGGMLRNIISEFVGAHV